MLLYDVELRSTRPNRSSFSSPKTPLLEYGHHQKAIFELSSLSILARSSSQPSGVFLEGFRVGNELWNIEQV